MIDQLRIGNLYSFDDFEASVKERKNNKPKKKVIKETVPFSNTVYDFSKINGELYWEERELEYVFEITASSPEELEEKKQPFISWVMNVMKEEIYDIFIEGYHFIGTFSDISEDDSEIEKSTITVKFTAYPYMIADEKTTSTFYLDAEESIDVVVKNGSSHRITPTFKSDCDVFIQMGNINFSVPSGEITDDSFQLEIGKNAMTIQGTESGTLTIEFIEEVF